MPDVSETAGMVLRESAQPFPKLDLGTSSEWIMVFSGQGIRDRSEVQGGSVLDREGTAGTRQGADAALRLQLLVEAVDDLTIIVYQAIGSMGRADGEHDRRDRGGVHRIPFIVQTRLYVSVAHWLR
jgi:hypothetical protein